MSQQFTFGQPVLYAGKRYLYLGMEGPDAVIARVLDADGEWDSESVHPATLTAITPSSFDGWCRIGPRNQWASPCKAYEAGQKSMSVSAPIPVEGEQGNSVGLEAFCVEVGEWHKGHFGTESMNKALGRKLLEEAAEFSCAKGEDSEEAADCLIVLAGWAHRNNVNLLEVGRNKLAVVKARNQKARDADASNYESPSNKEEGVPPGFFEENDYDYVIQGEDKVSINGQYRPTSFFVGRSIAWQRKFEASFAHIYRPISKEDSQSVGDAEQSVSATGSSRADTPNLLWRFGELMEFMRNPVAYNDYNSTTTVSMVGFAQKLCDDCLSMARPKVETPNIAWEEEAEREAFQYDIAAILRALGLGDHVRPISPHQVVHEEVIPAIAMWSEIVNRKSPEPPPGFEEVPRGWLPTEIDWNAWFYLHEVFGEWYSCKSLDLSGGAFEGFYRAGGRMARPKIQEVNK